MSRFLERMRNAQNTELETKSTERNPDQWVEVLRNTHIVGIDSAEVRLAKCRETRLTPPPELPSLTNSVISISATESYRILRTRLIRAQTTQGLHTLIVSSAISKEGKTLTTLNLAQAYSALKDQRVLLIDGDLRTRAMSNFFVPRVGPGLSDALLGEAEFADVI